MILNNYKIVEDNYKYNIVWGYINENNGEILFYSPSITKLIEKAYRQNKNFINIELLNTVIYFKNNFIQKKNNKETSIFREVIDNKLNYNLIEKQVYLNRKTNKWGLYKKMDHVGLLVDLSINDIENYKSLITNIILEHNENSKFHSINNSNIIKIMYNNTDLYKLNNLDSIFLKNKTMNKDLCNGFIELINLIRSNHYGDEFITLYVLTDSINMKNINVLYHTLLSEKKVDSKWQIINIETDKINLNDLEQIYM